MSGCICVQSELNCLGGQIHLQIHIHVLPVEGAPPSPVPESHICLTLCQIHLLIHLLLCF